MTADLYNRIGPTAFSLAVRVTTDPRIAEEAVATVFNRLDDPTRETEANNATRFLLNIRQQAFKERQENRRLQGETLLRDPVSFDIPGSASSETSSWLTEPQQKQLLHAFDVLPPQVRQAIELMFFEGLTESELATHLGLSQAVVREQIRAGLITLRDATVTAL